MSDLQWIHKQILKICSNSFSNFSCMFLNPNNLNSNFSNLSYRRNLEEQVEKANQKLFWPFTVQTNCSRYLKIFENSRPVSLEFQIFLSIPRTIFSHSRSGQFWQQNTKSNIAWLNVGPLYIDLTQPFIRQPKRPKRSSNNKFVQSISFGTLEFI